MGHLINPVALRLGWFFGWCDSWYVDFIYYPEFLHDVFRIRLYLNFMFFRVLFEKTGFFFSHFEIFYKYNFLAVRIFYYDGVLMTGIHTFNADFFNRFNRRGYFKTRRRSRRLVGSRVGRIFLGLFYSFFSFSDFFKPSYVKSIFFEEGLVDFRKFRRFSYFPLRILLAKKKVSRVSKIKAIRRSFPFEKIMKYLRFRVPGKFFNYDFMFDLKRFEKSRRRLFKILHRKLRFFRMQAAKNTKNNFLKRKSYDLNDLDNIRIPGRGRVRFLLKRTLRRLKRSMKWHLKFKSHFYQRKFRKKLRYIFYKTACFCNMGEFSKLLRVIRKFFYLNFPLQMEFNFFFIFIIFFRRLWHLLQFDSRKTRLFDFLAEFYFVTSFLFFFNGYNFKFIHSYVNCSLHLIVPKLLLKIGLFLIANDSVSARFLSAFVGKKILQGHKVRAAMHPIMRDLYLVSRGIKFTIFNFFDRVENNGFSPGFRHSVVKSFVLKFFFIFRRLFSKFFFFCNSWINCYFFFFLIIFLEFFMAKRCILVGASKKFMSKRHGFLFFFNFDFSFFNSNLFFVFNEIFFDFTSVNVTNSFFFFLIFDDLFSNYNSIFFKQFFRKLQLDLVFTSVVFFFNRLVRYSYWRYREKWVVEAAKLNSLKLRIFKNLKPFGLVGFKFHLRGRFSRKQKASSIWYGRGLVSLNTLAANLDYSFSSIAIKNSLISVRVWLYKNSFYPQWFLRQF